MNEITKTSIFIAVAIVLFFIAVLIQPRAPKMVPEKMVGRTLLESFTDPLDIKSLQIVKYDKQAGEAVDFRIAEIDGKWSIPSNQNYPADAADQMSNVVADFYDKKVLSVAYSDQSSNAEMREVHAMYGVVDPQSPNIFNPEDVGTKVTVTGDSQRILANLIVGKEVTDAPGQCYVRIPDQNSVYTIETSTANLSTRFDDWIQKNLLEISSFDLKSLEIDDYDIDTHPLTGEMFSRVHGKMTFDYDPMSSGEKWKLTYYTKADEKTNKVDDKTLGPDEAIDEEKLDKMRSAIDDLKIVDVLRKPESLAKALRENAPVQKLLNEPVLIRAGFHPAEVIKRDGTTVMKLVSSQGALSVKMKDGVVYQLNFGDLAGTQSRSESAESTEAAENEALKVDRYLLVIAEFDESLLEQPAIKPLPEIPTEEDPAEIEKIQKERETIEKENKRLEDAFQQKVADAQKKVKDLNAKFSDWFYVISEDVFKELHQTDADLIKNVISETQKDSTLPKGQFVETMMPAMEYRQETPTETPAAETPVTEIPTTETPMTEILATEALSQPETPVPAEPEAPILNEDHEDEPPQTEETTQTGETAE